MKTLRILELSQECYDQEFLDKSFEFTCLKRYVFSMVAVGFRVFRAPLLKYIDTVHHCKQTLFYNSIPCSAVSPYKIDEQGGKKCREFHCAAAGDRTRVTRVTGGNTYHYTTTTFKSPACAKGVHRCIIYLKIKFG